MPGRAFIVAKKLISFAILETELFYTLKMIPENDLKTKMINLM